MLRIFWNILLLLSVCISVKGQQLPELIPYVDDGKWGYCDSVGHVVITPQWRWADFFEGNTAAVALDAPFTKYYASINKKGGYVIPPERNWTGEWSGWAETKLNTCDAKGKWGMVDADNTLIIPYLYDDGSYYWSLDSFYWAHYKKLK